MRAGDSMGYLEPGTLLIGNHKYQVISEVGRGAMAVVYLARQLDLDRQVAVKVLSSQLASDSSFVLRFFNEVRAAAALSHPNIIQAYDAGIANGDIYYFAMEYVNGETLLRRILREGHLEVAATLKYASEIASALDYGWRRQRLTHGDIKPENIMVNEFDQAKLADFGLAKVAGHEYEGHELMFTPHYASPELIRGQLRKGDCRSDIYAFGASIYHLLSGKPPFPGSDGQLVMKCHLKERLVPLQQRCSGIRPELADFIDSMLAKDPAQRPASWSEVLAKLSEIRRSIAGTGDSDLSRIRLRRRSANVHLPVKQHSGKAQARHLPTKDRKKPADHFFWTLAIMFSLALLLFMAFLYWRKIKQDRRENIPSPQVQQAGFVTEKYPQADSKPVEDKAAPDLQENSPGVAAKSDVVVEKPATETAPVNQEAVVTEPSVAPVEQAQAAVAVQPAAEGPVEQAVVEVQPAAEGSVEQTVVEVQPAAVPEPAVLYAPYNVISGLNETQTQILTEAHIFYRLASFQYLPGRADSAEQLMRLLENGLEQNISENGRKLLLFMRQKLVSMLDEAPSQLLLHKQRLLGQSFSGKNNLKVVVKDVSLGAVQVEQILEKGGMQRNLSWRALSEAGLLLPMYKTAFFSSEIGAKPELYLAQLLFSGNARSYRSALHQYADMPGAQLAQWEELGARLILHGSELETRKNFAELARLCREGSRLEVSRQARRLQRSSEALPRAEKNLLENILAICRELQLDLRAGALLRQAQDLLNTRPDLALQKIQFARCLATAVKYPESKQIDSLQQRALQALDSRAKYEMPSLEPPLWPFMYSRNNQLAALNYQWLIRLHNHGEVAQEDLGWLQVLAHMADANWQLALQDNNLLQKGLDGGIRAGGGLAVLLCGIGLQQFYKGEPSNIWHDQIVALNALRLEGTAQVLGKTMLCFFSLLSRTKSADALPQDLSQSVGLLQEAPEAAKNVCLPSLFALLLENQQENSARQLWQAVLQEGADEILLSILRSLQSKELSEMTEKPQGTWNAQQAWQLLLRNFETRGDEYLLRLSLAMMAEQSLDGHDDARVLEIVQRKGSSWSLLGGDAVFDWLLRRVAHELQSANLNTACQLCSQVLELEEPRLLPYHPRMQMLRTALYCLQGHSAALQDLEFFLTNCLTASERDRRVCRSLGGGAKAAADKNETPYFWRELLLSCYLYGRKMPLSNEQILRETASMGFAAERTLFQALEQSFFNRSKQF